MTALRTAQVSPLPPPWQGQYDRVPIVSIENPYCEKLLNFNAYEGKLSLRKGEAYYTICIAATAHELIHLAVYHSTTDKLIAAVRNTGTARMEYYDITTSSPSLMYQSANMYGSTKMRHLEHGGSIYFMGDVSNMNRYDGSSWTEESTVGSNYFMGDSYRSRLYLAYKAVPLTLFYLGVEAISGAPQSFSLASAFTQPASIALIKAITVADTIGSQHLLGLVNAAGEVVAFSGSYPASSDWGIQGRWHIPKPLTYNCSIDYRGDTLVITEGGLVSMRDLFLKGAQAAIDQSLSLPIINRWRQIVKNSTTWGNSKYLINGTWDEVNNRIVIQFPFHVDYDGNRESKPHWLIYDIGRSAWYEHLANIPYSAVGLAKFNGDLYFGTAHGNEIFRKEGRTDFKDAQVNGSSTSGYEFRCKSAPLPLSRSGVNKVDGIEFITKGDYYADTTVTFTSDLGRSTSGSTTFPTLPFTTMQKQFISAGVEGTYVQWDLANTGTRTNSTYGCEIYGVNALYEQGGLR